MALLPRLERAECRKTPELVDAFTRGAPLWLMAAACAACLDRPECLAWALEHERYGFWGGHSAERRSLLRRAYGIKLREPTAHYHAHDVITPKEGEPRARYDDAA